MWYFASFMAGLFFGMFFTALFQANRNLDDKDRAEHAIKMQEYYKAECKEMQDIINKRGG